MAELEVRIFTDPVYMVRHYVIAAEIGQAAPTPMRGFGEQLDPVTANAVRITYTPCDPHPGQRTSLGMARLYSAVVSLDEWNRMPKGTLICQMPKRPARPDPQGRHRLALDHDWAGGRDDEGRTGTGGTGGGDPVAPAGQRQAVPGGGWRSDGDR